MIGYFKRFVFIAIISCLLQSTSYPESKKLELDTSLGFFFTPKFRTYPDKEWKSTGIWYQNLKPYLKEGSRSSTEFDSAFFWNDMSGTTGYLSVTAVGWNLLFLNKSESQINWNIIWISFGLSYCFSWISSSYLHSSVDHYNNWVDQNPEKIKNVQPNDSTLKVTYLYRF